MVKVINEQVRRFSEEIDQCVVHRPDGQVQVDLGAIASLVRNDGDVAHRQIELYCAYAAGSPSYLKTAALLAVACAVELGDPKPLRRVEDRAVFLGAEDVLLDLEQEVGLQQDCPSRQAAVAWWAAQPDGTVAVCDGCGDGLPRGDGYVLDSSRWLFGGLQVDLGEVLLCSRCYLRKRRGGSDG
ncbi:hypothetical protein ACFZA1_37570 [Streptomyces filipinensis]|uniref:hypothetical protein n=1 Tax=Streptomyces filipinensis TaxID=66887 RepID=UPI0036E78AA3